MGKYQLIALDMDGTLLRSDKSLDPATIRDIEEAAAADACAKGLGGCHL